MKTTNSKEEKKKMSNECPNCGYKMSMKDKTCKYCGSKNENYSKLIGFVEGLDESTKSNNVPQTSPQAIKVVYVFFGILCLFGLWPLSILFFILASREGKDN